jgi:hypothetical protein
MGDDGKTDPPMNVLDIRTGGRPPNVIPRPDPRTEERRRRQLDAVDLHAATDPVVRTTTERKASSLYEIAVALAEEAAALGWERRRHPPRSRISERISSRRVKALVDLSRVISARAALPSDECPVDPFSPQIAAVVALFMQTVERVAREVLDHDVVTAVMNGWKTKLAADPATAGFLQAAEASPVAPHSRSEP